MRKMDKIRIIRVKDERLRRVRTELRKLLTKVVLEEKHRLRVENKNRAKNELGSALKRSILFCTVCGSYESDMAYIPRIGGWICVECAERDGWIKEPELRKKLTMTNAQIHQFLVLLDRTLEQKACRTDHRYSRQILSRMRISEGQQEVFLEFCKILGGYCDCEIMMNAAEELSNI